MKKIFLLLIIFSLFSLAGSQVFAATGICDGTYEDSAGTIKSADDWCTRCKSETYHFCVDETLHSFQCKNEGFLGLACSCDETTAAQETCTAGCYGSSCSDYGCPGWYCNQAKTCLQLGGKCCSSDKVCSALDKILGASDCPDKCCKDTDKCSLPCINPSNTDKICTEGCNVNQDPDCGCKGGNGVCPPNCTSSNDSDCSTCVNPVKGDKKCTPGCTVDQDPECGCKSGDYYCGQKNGIDCDYTKDSDCAKTCSQAGGICCSDLGKICTASKKTGFSGCDECCEDGNNCTAPTCSDSDEENIHIKGTCQDSISTTPRTDFCRDDNAVYEFSCVQGKCNRQAIDCPSGEVCSSGVCVVSTTGGENLPSGKLEVDWPASPLGTKLTGESLTNLIQYLYEWGIGIGGFLAFIALIIAGFQYLTSAGNAGKMKDAMDGIRSAGLGLVLLFGSFLILNTINPQLTELKMPTMAPGEKAEDLKSIVPERKDYLATKTCIKATLYSGADKEGTSVLILKEGKIGSLSQEVVGGVVGSVVIEGNCLLTLYKLTELRENADNSPVLYSGEGTFNVSGTTKFGSAKLNSL